MVIGVREAAARAGRDEETVRRWVRTGRLAAQRDGPRLLIDEDELDALLGPVSLPLPAAWARTVGGAPQPDWAALVRRSRGGGG